MKIIGAAGLFLLLACQGPSDKSSKNPADTTLIASAAPRKPDTTSLGGGWVLQPALDADSATGKLPWLSFDTSKSKFVGNTGCNTMRGEFYFGKSDSSFSFSDKLITTKMACPGYNEGSFLKSLRNVTHYRLRNGMLTLLDDDHLEISRWTRKPIPAPSAIKT